MRLRSKSSNSFLFAKIFTHSMKKYLPVLVAILAGFSIHTAAQGVNRSEFKNVSVYVGKLGSAAGFTVQQIIDSFRAQKFSQHEMTYAIYTWMGTNMEYDGRAQRHPAHFNETASTAFTERYASSEGFANLFKAFCDVARVHCIIVHGIAKHHPHFISNLSEKLCDHYWNMVEIENTWYNIDVSWAPGGMDRKMKTFTTEFTDAWYYTDHTLFQMSHYTNNRKIKILPTGVNRAIFTNGPVICNGAVVFGIVPPLDMKGRLRGKEHTVTPLTFKLGNPALIKSIVVKTPDEQVIPSYSVKDHELNIDMPLLRSKPNELYLYVNGQKSFGFITDVKRVKEKKKKKPDTKATQKSR